MSQPITRWDGYWTNGRSSDYGVDAVSAWEAARKIGEEYGGDLAEWEKLPDGTFRRFLMVSETLGEGPSVRFEVRCQYQLIFTSHCIGDEKT